MHKSGDAFPVRIVCLTPETAETLYLLGEEHRIVGISGFTTRPARARRDKPKVAAFTSARIDKILSLAPDLVLAFSDLQADIVRALVQAGMEVHVFNQRDVAGILQMVRTLGALVGAHEGAERLIARLSNNIARVRESSASLVRRPRVYFEEWDEPMICGIGWVSELIAIAGGDDCFADLARARSAGGRVVADSAAVVERAPDIIIGSWCGKKFRPGQVAARAGWADVPAVRAGFLREIKSSIILQPGPAALTDGVKRIHQVLKDFVSRAPPA
ncbi:MAG TPA: ABC transporter substrate-binding protein [Burkholderiales bacterium]|nr:ABC transporter substrate-binding protein [Burkholderiales bacterium]